MKKRKERKGVGKATGMNWYRWVYPRSTPDSGGRNQHIPMLLPASRLPSTTWYLDIVTSFPFPIRTCICIWSSGKKRGAVFASLWTLKSALATWVGVSFSRGTTGCSRVVHYQVHSTVHRTLQLGRVFTDYRGEMKQGPSRRDRNVFGSECLGALWPWCLINMAPHPLRQPYTSPISPLNS